MHATPTPAPPPTPPRPTAPVSGADDIGAKESDDKCPLSANEADDKWAGARAAPLRCNNRRWMAWRRPPPYSPRPPTPSPAPVTGADLAPPALQGAEPPGRQSPRGPKMPRPPSREPTRAPLAEEQSRALSGIRGRNGRRACLRLGHAAVHTHGLHTSQSPMPLHGAPAAPVQAQSPPHGTMDTYFCAMHGHTSGTQISVHIQHKSVHTEPCIPMHCNLCTRLQKPLMSAHMYTPNMPACAWTWKYVNI